MKKLFLAFAITISSLIVSAQRFTYEPLKVEVNGIPSWSKDSTTITYPYIVTVGIVDEPHGFIAPDAGKNMFTFSLSVKEARSPESLQKYAWAKAAEWVKENYPDVK